jgi:predicted O-linked N-acetylglucosamine transferase (SPINDLY family)
VEGVAESEQAYEDLAVEWAGEPARLAKLRERLIARRETAPLFDIDGTTRAIEWALGEIAGRQRAGCPLEHLRRLG